MKKNSFVMLCAAALLFSAGFLGSSNAEEVKSVAWYTANLQEAKDKVQACHDNPSLKSASTECANARHALEISFGVAQR